MTDKEKDKKKKKNKRKKNARSKSPAAELRIESERLHEEVPKVKDVSAHSKQVSTVSDFTLGIHASQENADIEKGKLTVGHKND